MTDDKNFYSHGEWTRVKNGRINYDKKTCQVCGRKYKETNKFNVDHIIMRKLLQEDQWYDKTNLWTLCTCCNGIKQSLEHIFNDNQLQTITKSQWIKLIRNNKNYCKAKCQH
ncbi:HNH endonuclease [Lactobacillus melliventris]|uniref:HNH domain-containing protein n=1 Tax=Lactobacillus melliventris TaxID=1218507 RepID=A0A0F4LCW2_9LACO|nr:HNH endonuclease signature motif containing protein [Lactobacillus melliventris]KJY56687.1 hypothetical protein JF74_10340 [Lactobacillus melliventris]